MTANTSVYAMPISSYANANLQRLPLRLTRRGGFFLLDASFWILDAGKTQKKEKTHSESRNRGRRIPFLELRCCD
jgi:hypothetical protein